MYSNEYVIMVYLIIAVIKHRFKYTNTYLIEETDEKWLYLVSFV